MRVGVACRQSPSVHTVAMSHWKEELPTSSPPTSAQVDSWYFSKADFSLFTSFQTCVHKHTNLNQCLGLLLHGPHGSAILGQWRWDREVSDRMDLPTSLVLVNATDGKLPYICVAGGDAQQILPTINIKGTLEWWTGPEGSQVSQVQAEDPFMLL